MHALVLMQYVRTALQYLLKDAVVALDLAAPPLASVVFHRNFSTVSADRCSSTGVNSEFSTT